MTCFAGESWWTPIDGAHMPVCLQRAKEQANVLSKVSSSMYSFVLKRRRNVELFLSFCGTPLPTQCNRVMAFQPQSHSIVFRLKWRHKATRRWSTICGVRCAARACKIPVTSGAQPFS